MIEEEHHTKVMWVLRDCYLTHTAAHELHGAARELHLLRLNFARTAVQVLMYPTQQYSIYVGSIYGYIAKDNAPSL